EWIAKKIGATSKINLEPLLSLSFLEMYQDARNTLADCKQSACLEESRGEKSREETEREKDAAAPNRSELAWRVEQTWEAHVAQCRGFYEDVDGRSPSGPPPTLTAEIREHITRALRE